MGNYYHSHGGTQHHALRPQGANPYFAQDPFSRTMGASPAESPLEQPGGSAAGQTTGHVTGRQADAGKFAPFGTSPNEYLYQHSHDRFPFYGTDTYAAAPIRG